MTSPTVIVVSRAATRKLASSLTGCGALSATSTTTSRIGQKAEATASGMSSATRRAYSPGSALLRFVQPVRVAVTCVPHASCSARTTSEPPRRREPG